MDNNNTVSRRDVSKALGKLFFSVPLLIFTVGCGKKNSAVCSDPNRLSAEEISLRESLNYVEIAVDREKTCKDCGFFETSTTGSACGQCQIFHSEVNSEGYCESWSSGT